MEQVPGGTEPVQGPREIGGQVTHGSLGRQAIDIRTENGQRTGALAEKQDRAGRERELENPGAGF